MEILKFDGGKPSKNRNKLVTVIAGAFLVAVVGSTFAANITINTNNSLEYGQGLTQAAACDPGLTITPANRFTNTSNGGTFYLETITVTDTSSVTTSTSVGLGNCKGKTLRLRAYGDSGAALTLTAGTTPTYCDVAIADPGFAAGVVEASVTNSACVGTITKLAKGFSLALTTPSLNASSIYKLTIESF